MIFEVRQTLKTDFLEKRTTVGALNPEASANSLAVIGRDLLNITDNVVGQLFFC